MHALPYWTMKSQFRSRCSGRVQEIAVGDKIVRVLEALGFRSWRSPLQDVISEHFGLGPVPVVVSIPTPGKCSVARRGRGEVVQAAKLK